MGKFLGDAEIRGFQSRIHELEMALAETEALEISHGERIEKQAKRIEELLNHIDDVNEAICDPYRWCDDIDVLRKIEKLLLKGSKLIGDAK